MSKKPIALVVLVVVIIIAAIIANFSKPAAIKPSAQKYDVPIKNNYFLGASSSRLTIIEFTDFACPFCKSSYPAVREMSVKYKDSVRIVYKDFPLHDNSLDLAMAGRCAGEQGLFWPMHDKLFALQGQFATTSLPDMAASIGANRTAFATCLASKRYLGDIKRDYLDGQALNLEGTPTFFFNGYKLAGELSSNRLEEIIKEFLK